MGFLLVSIYTVFEIFALEKYLDLETRVRSYSRHGNDTTRKTAYDCMHFY